MKTKNMKDYIDISIPLNKKLSAFGADPISIERSWSRCSPRCDSVNADTVKNYCPHLHGTHTESVFHISDEKESYFQSDPAIAERYWTENLNPFKALCTLVIYCEPVPAKQAITNETLPKCADLESDLIITKSCIMKLLPSNQSFDLDALAICSGPNNGPWKKSKSWQWDAAIPYLTPEAASFISNEQNLGIKHLLLDLPSIDRLSDGGELLCHKAFFDGKRDRFITELCYFDDNQIIYNKQNYNLYFHYLPWYLLGDVIPTRPILTNLKLCMYEKDQ